MNDTATIFRMFMRCFGGGDIAPWRQLRCCCGSSFFTKKFPKISFFWPPRISFWAFSGPPDFQKWEGGLGDGLLGRGVAARGLGKPMRGERGGRKRPARSIGLGGIPGQNVMELVYMAIEQM